MAAKAKISIFSSFKNRFQENRMTFINASVTIILIGIVIAVLLTRASALQRRTAEESLVNLAGRTANEVQSYLLTQFDAVRGIARLLESYGDLEPSRRRGFFNDTMGSALNSYRNLMNLYSVWKPNALDGLDALYANIGENDETGQFTGGFTREHGWVEQRNFYDYEALLDMKYTHYLGYGVETLSAPRSALTINPFSPAPDPGSSEASSSSWIVDTYIPVFGAGSDTAETGVLGIIGAAVNLGQLQTLCEATQPYDTGRTFVCTNDGTIIAHPDARLRGTNVLKELAADDNFQDPSNDTSSDPAVIPGQKAAFWETNSAENETQTAAGNQRIQRGVSQISESIRNAMTLRQSVVYRGKQNLIVITPIRTISSLTSAVTFRISSAYEGSVPNWMLITTVPISSIMATIIRLLRFSILFIIAAGAVTGLVLFLSSRSITQQSRRLQQNLERATAMQDNLKYGLFLMDDKYLIQGAYSKALEKILSVPSLQDKNFLDLLTSSLRENEREGFSDYLQMIFKSSFDEGMLESINPINDFTYISNDTGEQKSLRTSFKLTGSGRGAEYILGTMEDITAEKELEKQLLEAENQIETEMHSLFEVLQLNPRVLSDFIEDAEYEFTSINEVLKKKEHIRREVMFEIYQSIHAVKSDALILNLENFSARLHDLESSVKIIQEKNEEYVPFDDLLGLVLEIDVALKEKDQLKAAISKIENFRKMHGDSGNQEMYVLVETLTQVCNKTQASLNKRVKFVVDVIDEAVLDHGPRRVIKEVLTQLVRNAVYHGIEIPAERVSLGKEPVGEIKLSIRFINNQIIIKFTDDGRGIDFNSVRQRAMAQKMFRIPSDANDKNQLLKALFSPGFSTLESADLHGGRGVGLSLVKDRIKDLLGNITVSTAQGRGTTFTISIPMELPVLANKAS